MNRASFQIIGCLSLAILLCSTAHAGPNLRPTWLKGLQKPKAEAVDPNESFFADLDRNSSALEAEEFREYLFDAGRAEQIKQNYVLANRDYELHQHHGLVDIEEQKLHSERMIEFRKEMVRNISQTQSKRTRERVQGAAKRGDIAKPLVISSTLASVYLGNPVHVDISDRTKVIASTDFQAQKGQLEVNSPAITGSVDVTNKFEHKPNEIKQDPTVGDEKYRVKLSRGLSLWEMSSGLTYGGTSRTLAASVSKPLSDHLTCVVDTVRPVGQEASASEERVKLLYGLSF